MADLMANVRKAQELVKTEGAKVQEELAAYVPSTDFDRGCSCLSRDSLFNHSAMQVTWLLLNNIFLCCHRAEFEGFSEDETVRVVVSGNQLPVAVDITDEAMQQGAEVPTS